MLDALCTFAAHGMRAGALAADSQWSPLYARHRFDLVLGSSIAGRTAFIRIVEREAPPLALAAIGYEAPDLEAIRQAVHAPAGLVLVVGPAGSGKTTSLYSMLGLLDPRRRSIQTIESPVRCPVDRWLQFEIAQSRRRRGAERWEHRLGWLLQNGPDAILLGRIATPGTVQLALQAACSGSLVFSTMTVERASNVLAELYRLRAQPAQVLAALSLAIAQRLIGRLCPDCSEPDERGEVRAVLAAALNTWLAGASVRARRASETGCARCNGTGYLGRILVYELIEIDSRVRGLIGSAAETVELERALVADGRTLWDHGLKRVADGMTSLDALRAAVRPPR